MRWLAVIALYRFLHHILQMHSETEQLAKGQSYPLKPSTLVAALEDAGIQIDAYLMRSRGSIGMFNAHFWTQNPNIPHERLYIQLGPVPTKNLSETKGRVEAVLLPQLIEWIGDILSLDERSPVRREHQTLRLGPL